MSDLISVTCPHCDSDVQLDLNDDLDCLYCGADLDGVPFVITNLFEDGDIFQDEVN